MGSYDLPQKFLGVGNANKEPTREPGHFCSVCAWGGEKYMVSLSPGRANGPMTCLEHTSLRRSVA